MECVSEDGMQCERHAPRPGPLAACMQVNVPRNRIVVAGTSVVERVLSIADAVHSAGGVVQAAVPCAFKAALDRVTSHRVRHRIGVWPTP